MKCCRRCCGSRIGAVFTSCSTGEMPECIQEVSFPQLCIAGSCETDQLMSHSTNASRSQWHKPRNKPEPKFWVRDGKKLLFFLFLLLLSHLISPLMCYSSVETPLARPSWAWVCVYLRSLTHEHSLSRCLLTLLEEGYNLETSSSLQPI